MLRSLGKYSDSGEDAASPPVNDDSSDDDERFLTEASGAKSGQTAKVVDMTPPDLLLERARKRIGALVRKQRIDKCIEELCRCVALTRIVFGDEHWRHAQAYAHLAETYLDLKGNAFAQQACQNAETARNIMQKLVASRENILTFSRKLTEEERAEFTRTVFAVYFTLGKCYIMQKKFKDAESCLHKSETVLEKELDSQTDEEKDEESSDDDLESKKPSKKKRQDRFEIDDLKIALQSALGRLYGKQKQAANALLHYEKALHLAKKRHGSDSVMLVPIYNALGYIEQNRADFPNHAAAIEWFVKAHDVTEKNYERGSVELADSARAVATAYSLTNDSAAEANAESFLQEHIAMIQGAQGTHHPKVLELQEDLARLYVRTGRASQAIELLRNIARTKKLEFGEFHAKLSETYRLLGNVYLKQGDVKSAVGFFEKALKIDEVVLGKSHKVTKETAETLEFLSKQQKQNEAEKKPFMSTVRPVRVSSAASSKA